MTDQSADNESDRGQQSDDQQATPPASTHSDGAGTAFGPTSYQHGGASQTSYGQTSYGQTPYGQAPYGETPYGQAPYGKTPYRQAPYAAAPSEQPYFVPTAHQQAWSAAQQFPGGQYWSPPPVAPKPRHHKLLFGSVAAAIATAVAAGGIAVAVDRSTQDSSQQAAVTSPNSQNAPFGQEGNGKTSPYGNSGGFGTGGGLGSGSDGSGSDGTGSDGTGSDGTGSDGTGSGSASSGVTGTATSAQQVGVVDINTTLNYGQGKAAGTGIVLSTNGEILTNNHVIEGSTAISVTIVSTGKTYTATVVGTDPTDDVAVIQLKNASGLSTAKLGDSSKVAVGTAVTAVGNAGGTGGTPSSATGTVTALNQSITASDTNGSNTEQLTGMIQVNANIQAGDSGGPLYENSGGTVIGMDTAASSSVSRYSSSATTGFAIPIAKALGIADKIDSGQASSTVHIGYPAFFGVQLSTEGQTAGAAIAGTVDGSGAANAGLQAGDTITAVDGKAIASATALSAVTAAHKPGDQVKVTYTNGAGASQTVTVTLGAGPAD